MQRHPNVGQSASEGTRVERETGRGLGEGAPPPLGGRKTTEEQAQEIVDRIINQLPGQSPPNGQAPAPHRRQTRPTWGGRGRGDRDRSSGGREGGRRGGNRETGQQDPPHKEGSIAKRLQSTKRRRSRHQRRKRWKEGTCMDRPQGGQRER